MKVIDFGQTNSILNQYISEIRNVEVQNDRLRFRRNIERIGEIMAYEMSKEFKYSVKNIQTPLGIAPVSTPDNNLVISTILRAGLPFQRKYYFCSRIYKGVSKAPHVKVKRDRKQNTNFN